MNSSATADARIDHQINSNNLLFGRYTYNSVSTLTPGIFPATKFGAITVQPGGNVASFPGPADETATNIMLDYIHTINTSLVSEFKAGYTQFTTSPTL
jgi:hypothetical protein